MTSLKWKQKLGKCHKSHACLTFLPRHTLLAMGFFCFIRAPEPGFTSSLWSKTGDSARSLCQCDVEQDRVKPPSGPWSAEAFSTIDCWSSLRGQSTWCYGAGHTAVLVSFLLNTLLTRVSNHRGCCKAPVPVLVSSALSCSHGVSISPWLVFQKGKNISLVSLVLYCKPSFNLWPIYLNINLPFKCSQAL